MMVVQQPHVVGVLIKGVPDPDIAPRGIAEVPRASENGPRQTAPLDPVSLRRRGPVVHNHDAEILVPELTQRVQTFQRISHPVPVENDHPDGRRPSHSLDPFARAYRPSTFGECLGVIR
jgi:hypothetical protein